MDLSPIEEIVRTRLLAGDEAVAAEVSSVGDPRVRASFLRHMLTHDPQADNPRRIQLRGFEIVGTLDLRATDVGRPLALEFCRIAGLDITEGSSRALHLYHCVVSDQDSQAGLKLMGAHLRGSATIVRSTVYGTIELIQTEVDGDIRLDSSKIHSAKELAVAGDRLKVHGGVFMRRTDVNDGCVRLPGARIDGQFSCDGAKILASSNIANGARPSEVLNLDSAEIGGALLLRNYTYDRPERAFTAQGEVRLAGARVRGSVEISGTFTADDVAIRANGLSATAFQIVEHKPRLAEDDKHFVTSVSGEIRLRGMTISGDLAIGQVALRSRNGTALDLTRSTVQGKITFEPSSVEGAVRLVGCTTGRLEDDIARWPGSRDFDGFSYGSIGAAGGQAEPTVKDRLKWLPAEFKPQPYEQLLGYYRSQGRDKERRTVAIEKQRKRRERLQWWQKPWAYFLDWTVGFGYRPGQALLWLLGLLIVGSLVVDRLYSSGAITLRSGIDPAPDFNALLYTLDLLLPVISLRQRDLWLAMNLPSQVAVAALVTFGWMIAAAAVAALAGIIKKD